MLRKIFAVVCGLFLLVSCGSQKDGDPSPSGSPSMESPTLAPSSVLVVNPDGTTVAARFIPPASFTRVVYPDGSLGRWLQDLPLQPDGSPVLLFDGTVRSPSNHAAVIKLDIGSTDSQQGTDAYIRLVSEYLFAADRAQEITFHFFSGFICDFATWSQGNRIHVEGKKVSWVKKENPASDYDTLRSYLRTINAYSNAKSILTDTQEAGEWAAGCLLLNTEAGAAMIADAAVNEETGAKAVIVVQAKSPAEDIHILKNPSSLDGSPWFIVDNGINTLDGRFTDGDLRSFLVT